MGSIFMGISNIFIIKPSPSSSSSATARVAAKEAYIDLWDRRGGGGDIGGERILDRVRN